MSCRTRLGPCCGSFVECLRFVCVQVPPEPCGQTLFVNLVCVYSRASFIPSFHSSPFPHSPQPQIPTVGSQPPPVSAARKKERKAKATLTREQCLGPHTVLLTSPTHQARPSARGPTGGSRQRPLIHGRAGHASPSRCFLSLAR